MRPVAADIADPAVAALVGRHARLARTQTALGCAHALDPADFSGPDIRLWAIRDAGEVLAVGALRRLGEAEGEVKAMHTAEAARRRGAGRVMLAHIVAEARLAGMRRLSLETGAWPYFEAARALYRRHGFVECGPFSAYRSGPNSVFMTLALDDDRA